LTGYAQTRKLEDDSTSGNNRGICLHIHGCRVQHRCTIVAPFVAANIKQNQGFSQQVQRCNGFPQKTPTCARVRIHARAHVGHNTCCTVAPLHFYYKVLISLKIRCNNKCNTVVAPLHQALALAGLKVVKTLISLCFHPKPIVYRGLKA
jgi:hypothetical protein